MAQIAIVFCVLLLAISCAHARTTLYLIGNDAKQVQMARNFDGDDDDDDDYQAIYDECIQHYATCKQSQEECMSCASTCFNAAMATDDEEQKTKLSYMAHQCQAGDFDDEEDAVTLTHTNVLLRELTFSNVVSKGLHIITSTCLLY